MSEFKGTKGKWEVKDKSRLESTIYSNRKRICDVKSFGSDFTSLDSNGNECSEPTTEERICNEKLIVCAPEMLEMLQTINSFIVSNIDKNYMVRLLSREVSDIKLLIKKATE
jgi:hypothetical protein